MQHFYKILDNANGDAIHERGVNFWSQGMLVVSCDYEANTYHATHTPIETTFHNGMAVTNTGAIFVLERGAIPMSKDELLAALISRNASNQTPS